MMLSNFCHCVKVGMGLSEHFDTARGNIQVDRFHATSSTSHGEYSVEGGFLILQQYLPKSFLCTLTILTTRGGTTKMLLLTLELLKGFSMAHAHGRY